MLAIPPAAPRRDRPPWRAARENSSPAPRRMISSAETATYVTGSSAVTPNSSDDIRRVSRQQPPARGPRRPRPAADHGARTFACSSAGCGAERHSDADFARPLRHHIGNDAVDPDDAEHQRHPSGDHQHHERERRPCHRLVVERPSMCSDEEHGQPPFTDQMACRASASKLSVRRAVGADREQAAACESVPLSQPRCTVHQGRPVDDARAASPARCCRTRCPTTPTISRQGSAAPLRESACRAPHRDAPPLPRQILRHDGDARFS